MPLQPEVGSERVPPTPDALDVERVIETCRSRLARAATDDLELGMRTLGRLQPPRWALEWHLPVWLGRAFGLPPRLIDDLVVSTVLGLVSIRLLDDLEDGDVDEADRAPVARLADACYLEALVVYRDRLPEASPFWPFLDRTMRGWRSPGRRLAARGAPLKVPAFGASLLGGRVDAWPRLESCLDHALTALVLYDHFTDWEMDLAAGRWNAFVASFDGVGDDLGDQSRARSRILAAMLTGGALGRFFERIETEARAGARLAASLGIVPLAEHLDEYGRLTAAQGSLVVRHYLRAGDRITELVFGARSTPGTHVEIRGRQQWPMT